jgi:hypothetical protein
MYLELPVEGYLYNFYLILVSGENGKKEHMRNGYPTVILTSNLC